MKAKRGHYTESLHQSARLKSLESKNSKLGNSLVAFFG